MNMIQHCMGARGLPLFVLVLFFANAHAGQSDTAPSLAEEVHRFAKVDADNPPSPCQVEFVGSSTIRLWGDALSVDMAPIPVINRGFGGSQIEHVNQWFDALVRAYRPSAIVFYEGDNDIDAGKPVDRVLSDFDSFMALKVRALRDTPVYFVSIKPSKLRADQLSRQRRVNEAIRHRSAGRTDLRYIDVASSMLAGGKPKDIFESDGLHMTRAGYAIWTRVIKAALQRDYESDVARCETRALEQPQTAADGAVHVPAFLLPESSLLNSETKRKLAEERKLWEADTCQRVEEARPEELPAIRECHLQLLQRHSFMSNYLKRFPVNILQQQIGGVQTDVFVPNSGIAPENEERVLINLHGGHFLFGWRTMSTLESAPIAATGRFKVVSVNYRLAPESSFPAASEDVTSVYRALLEHYAPKNIGIYGCSAGGLLTAESMAWFQDKGLPLPAAVGLFGSGAAYYQDGDSAPYAAAREGWLPITAAGHPYFKTTDAHNPLAFPIESSNILARFPPALLLTSTRDLALSSVVFTHEQLVKLGVSAELHVWEGMSHCFMFGEDVPQASDAHQRIVKFFENHLAR